jgi:hypothetical protein
MMKTTKSPSIEAVMRRLMVGTGGSFNAIVPMVEDGSRPCS